MNNELLKELQRVQEKLRTIDKLSNCIQTLNAKESKEVAHLIHCIIDSEYIDTTLAREVTYWQIQSKKDIFINV